MTNFKKLGEAKQPVVVETTIAHKWRRYRILPVFQTAVAYKGRRYQAFGWRQNFEGG
ncbi:MAG: hypothetical protein ACUVRR_07680 [Candidatus Fervidibacter sp.]|uniref:hypothetical protein n=1 Tax=Candidatus Fervidibacter sp. TaxID=3100871 RepID=UPI00404AE933